MERTRHIDTLNDHISRETEEKWRVMSRHETAVRDVRAQLEQATQELELAKREREQLEASRKSSSSRPVEGKGRRLSDPFPSYPGPSRAASSSHSTSSMAGDQFDFPTYRTPDESSGRGDRHTHHRHTSNNHRHYPEDHAPPHRSANQPPRQHTSSHQTGHTQRTYVEDFPVNRSPPRSRSVSRTRRDKSRSPSRGRARVVTDYMDADEAAQVLSRIVKTKGTRSPGRGQPRGRVVGEYTEIPTARHTRRHSAVLVDPPPAVPPQFFVPEGIGVAPVFPSPSRSPVTVREYDFPVSGPVVPLDVPEPIFSPSPFDPPPVFDPPPLPSPVLESPFREPPPLRRPSTAVFDAPVRRMSYGPAFEPTPRRMSTGRVFEPPLRRMSGPHHLLDGVGRVSLAEPPLFDGPVRPTLDGPIFDGPPIPPPVFYEPPPNFEEPPPRPIFDGPIPDGPMFEGRRRVFHPPRPIFDPLLEEPPLPRGEFLNGPPPDMFEGHLRRMPPLMDGVMMEDFLPPAYVPPPARIPPPFDVPLPPLDPLPEPEWYMRPPPRGPPSPPRLPQPVSTTHLLPQSEETKAAWEEAVKNLAEATTTNEVPGTEVTVSEQIVAVTSSPAARRVLSVREIWETPEGEVIEDKKLWDVTDGTEPPRLDENGDIMDVERIPLGAERRVVSEDSDVAEVQRIPLGQPAVVPTDEDVVQVERITLTGARQTTFKKAEEAAEHEAPPVTAEEQHDEPMEEEGSYRPLSPEHDVEPEPEQPARPQPNSSSAKPRPKRGKAVTPGSWRLPENKRPSPLKRKSVPVFEKTFAKKGVSKLERETSKLQALLNKSAQVTGSQQRSTRSHAWEEPATATMGDSRYDHYTPTVLQYDDEMEQGMEHAGPGHPTMASGGTFSPSTSLAEEGWVLPTAGDAF